MLDDGNDPVVGASIGGSKGLTAVDRYSGYLSTKIYPSPGVGPRSSDLYDLMNGPIRKKLKIIPENVT